MTTKRINTTRLLGQKLGTGVLNWNRSERQSNRYGAVHLSPTPMELSQVYLRNLPVGRTGRLMAKVIETRQSYNLGDWFRGLRPVTPKKGDEILLGEGTLFEETHAHGQEVGVKPADDRPSDWMDPEALYRCHFQTVELWFYPED